MFRTDINFFIATVQLLKLLPLLPVVESYFELLATLPTTAKRNTASLARVRKLPEEYVQKSQSVLVCVSNLGRN